MNINIFNNIESFEAKRNCAITLLLQANSSYQKYIGQIERKVNAMKNESKKRQLRTVISKIIKESKNIQNLPYFKSNGLIVCCGLSNSDETGN